MIVFIVLTLLVSGILAWWLTYIPIEPLVLQDPIVSCPRCLKELNSNYTRYEGNFYQCNGVRYLGISIELNKPSSSHSFVINGRDFYLEVYFPKPSVYVRAGKDFNGHFIKIESKTIKIALFEYCDSMEIINKYFKLLAFS